MSGLEVLGALIGTFFILTLIILIVWHDPGLIIVEKKLNDPVKDTEDYQQGFYDGVSKVRQMLADSQSDDPTIVVMLARIDALLHEEPAV